MLSEYREVEEIEQDYSDGLLNPETFATYAAEAAVESYSRGKSEYWQFMSYVDQADKVAIEFYMENTDDFDIEVPDVDFPLDYSQDHEERELQMQKFAGDLVSGQIDVFQDSKIVSVGTSGIGVGALVSDVTGRKNNVAICNGRGVEVYGEDVDGEEIVLVGEDRETGINSRIREEMKFRAEVVEERFLSDSTPDSAAGPSGFQAIKSILSF